MKCKGYPAESYGLYVLQQLEEPEATEIREHLAGECATCRREVQASSALWHMLALGQAEEVQLEPPRRLRSRVLNKLNGSTRGALAADRLSHVQPIGPFEQRQCDLAIRRLGCRGRGKQNQLYSGCLPA